MGMMLIALHYAPFTIYTHSCKTLNAGGKDLPSSEFSIKYSVQQCVKNLSQTNCYGKVYI